MASPKRTNDEASRRSGEGGEASSFHMEEIKTCLSSFVDSGSIESRRYYLARRTALEMIRDRGYSVPPSEIDLTLEEFRACYGEVPDVDRLQVLVSHSSETSKKLKLSFAGPVVINVSWVRQVALLDANGEGWTDLILVVEGKVTSQAQKALELFKFKVEVFVIGDLLVNITKHVLMPAHEVLSDQGKQKLLKKYSIDEKQIPRIRCVS